jgi:hypothetical protein
MNPSRFFRAGGGPCTVPAFGCSPWIAIGCAVVALLLMIACCAHAGGWPIPRSAYSTVRTPDPVVKVCTEERITTMAQAGAADRKVCK